MAQRIILDTDIGTDVDDLLALALALRSPELDLVAVTCVYGDVGLRARIVRKVLQMAGREDVPIGLGVRQPLLRSRPVYWAGHEGVGILDGHDADGGALPHAIDLIIQTVNENPGEVTLVAIGPLTNLAAAVIREPEIGQRVRGVVMMGGVARVTGGVDLPGVEHNMRCDPEAAQVVFTAGWPITMVGLDVTTQVMIRRDQLGRLLAGGTPLHHLLVDQVVRYMRSLHRDWTYLHDPLAIGSLIEPGLLRTESMRVEVEWRSEALAGATVARRPTGEQTANARVSVGVEANRFLDLFLRRLSGS